MNKYIGRNKYVFERHRPIHKSAFKTEKRRLSSALKGKDVTIEHVGSTAVPGLGGRNILDIAIGVKEGSLRNLKPEIERLGYAFSDTGGTTQRLFFTRCMKFHSRRVNIHLHLERFDGLAWKRHTAFRDYLIKHRAAMLEYAAIKKKAASSAKGDRELYRKIKGPLIRKFTKRAIGGN